MNSITAVKAITSMTTPTRARALPLMSGRQVVVILNDESALVR
jgi:hypothetical protein